MRDLLHSSWTLYGCNGDRARRSYARSRPRRNSRFGVVTYRRVVHVYGCVRARHEYRHEFHRYRLELNERKPTSLRERTDMNIRTHIMTTSHDTWHDTWDLDQTKTVQTKSYGTIPNAARRQPLIRSERLIAAQGPGARGSARKRRLRSLHGRGLGLHARAPLSPREPAQMLPQPAARRAGQRRAARLGRLELLHPSPTAAHGAGAVRARHAALAQLGLDRLEGSARAGAIDALVNM